MLPAMRQVALGHIASIAAGWQSPPDRIEGTVVRALPAVSVGDIVDGRVDLTGLGRIPAPLGGNLDRYLVQPGDVLVACRGTQPKVAIAPSELAGVLLTSTLIMVRLHDDLLPEVLFAYLRSSRGQRELLGLVRSGTKQFAVSPRDLARLLVPVPTMEMQRRIAALVDVAEGQFQAGLEAATVRRDVAYALAGRLLAADEERSRSRQ